MVAMLLCASDVHSRWHWEGLQVEMFVICTPEQSEGMLQELVALERQLYSELGLHFKVLLCRDGLVLAFLSSKV